MTAQQDAIPMWRERLQTWLTPSSLAMFFFGFAAGLPILLIFSTLSMWLREAGVSRSAVTFFSWAALAYSFKFIWAPLVDLLPIPVLTPLLGRRRGWLCLAQLGVIASIIAMALIDPAASSADSESHALLFMSLATICLGFSSATQDTVIDAYRIECATEEFQALLASVYIAGYRMGMLVSGAGSLFLAQVLGTSMGAYSYPAWRSTYLVMALVMVIGLGTTFVVSEPKRDFIQEKHQYSGKQHLRLLALFFCCVAVFGVSFFYSGIWLVSVKEMVQSNCIAFFVESSRLLFSLVSTAFVARFFVVMGLADRQMMQQSYIAPVTDFFVRYGVRPALLILLLIGSYRFSDIVLGVISNVFYLDLGFSKADIAAVSKTFGLFAGLLGGFLGGGLALRYGVYKILLLGAVLSAATNILFLLLTHSGADIAMLTLVIGADNLAAGVAGAAFVAFLSSLTSYSFTAVQYAIFSSLMTLMPKFIGGYSGTIVASAGYDLFFLFTAGSGIPVVVLIWVVWKQAGKKSDEIEGAGRDKT